jgi:hypothetical protein
MPSLVLITASHTHGMVGTFSPRSAGGETGLGGQITLVKVKKDLHNLCIY